VRSGGLGNGVLGTREDTESQGRAERRLLPAGWEGGSVEWEWAGEGGLNGELGGRGDVWLDARRKIMYSAFGELGSIGCVLKGSSVAMLIL